MAVTLSDIRDATAAWIGGPWVPDEVGGDLADRFKVAWEEAGYGSPIVRRNLAFEWIAGRVMTDISFRGEGFEDAVEALLAIPTHLEWAEMVDNFPSHAWWLWPVAFRHHYFQRVSEGREGGYKYVYSHGPSDVEEGGGITPPHARRLRNAEPLPPRGATSGIPFTVIRDPREGWLLHSDTWQLPAGYEWPLDLDERSDGGLYKSISGYDTPKSTWYGVDYGSVKIYFLIVIAPLTEEEENGEGTFREDVKDAIDSYVKTESAADRQFTPPRLTAMARNPWLADNYFGIYWLQ